MKEVWLVFDVNNSNSLSHFALFEAWTTEDAAKKRVRHLRTISGDQWEYTRVEVHGSGVLDESSLGGARG